MDLSVPKVSASCSVWRLPSGGEVTGRVLADPIAWLLHWDGARSVPCSDCGRWSLGPLCDDPAACPHCAKGGAPQWAGFVVVDTGERRVMLQLGARGLAKSGIDNLGMLRGAVCRFYRPRATRFVLVDRRAEGFMADPPRVPIEEYLQTLWRTRVPSLAAVRGLGGSGAVRYAA